MPQFDEEKQIKKLQEIRMAEEEDLAKILSVKYGVQYIDLTGLSINTDALKLIPEKEARERKMAVFDILGEKIKIAVVSPNNPETIEKIKELESKNYKVTILMTSLQSLEKAWERYADMSFSVRTEGGLLSISSEGLEKNIEESKGLEDIKKSLEQILGEEKTNKVSRFFDMVLAGAMSLEASDIHIEPEEEISKIRFRLDGILTHIVDFDTKTYNLVLSRIKLISGLKLNVKKNAQDGRISIRLGKAEIEIRVSTMPGAYGESVVMRILNPDAISVPVEELGIEPNLLKTLEREIKKPNGMILNTGPTGSGKTTTLYAFLKKIYSSEIKIITIEDPVEYHIKGITQTQTDKEKNYTFANGLRSALRQDPDVVMVGEIRDNETAEIAVNSALTGHLVLSTLHTNTAAGTFPRFAELGVNPKILGSAVNITMAQRLVRKLCPYCKKEIPVEGENKILVDEIIGSVLNIEKYQINSTDKMYEPVGCEKCNNIGYKGRIGVFEAILVDENIENILKEYPSEREIKKEAEKQGILDMKQDGIIKVLNGVTSLDELKRVIELD
ncbi:GspE/PulE family protein [Patescibacteria group bacterium]|nr:GspE/PulE family protein [Patescibacteria group bacterium]MCG2695304.1 GspE/PulE family protein [Candidatus Parcubacteria bacterium]